MVNQWGEKGLEFWPRSFNINNFLTFSRSLFENTLQQSVISPGSVFAMYSVVSLSCSYKISSWGTNWYTFLNSNCVSRRNAKNYSEIRKKYNHETVRCPEYCRSKSYFSHRRLLWSVRLVKEWVPQFSQISFVQYIFNSMQIKNQSIRREAFFFSLLN